jgi:hypothetical protein
MGKYAKAVVATLGAALAAAQTALPMSATGHGWVTVLIAALTALTVYLVPNSEQVPAR